MNSSSTDITKRQWRKNAADAMEGLIGVNDQLDFSDIRKVLQLAIHAKEAAYFKKKIDENKKLKDEGKDVDDELKYVTSCAAMWEREFIKELHGIKDFKRVVECAQWELEHLARIANEVRENIKYYHDWYQIEVSRGIVFN